MIFGDDFSVPETVAPGDWIERDCRGAWGTVGALVPNQYSMVLRDRAPDPMPGDWWSAYRRLFEIVASVGARHTRTPDRAWFAVWEGHGFATATTHIAWRDPPIDDDTRRRREEERLRLREEDGRRNSAIRSALSLLPQFHLPNRTYYLFGGPVSAVAEVRNPDSSTEWRNPDLFWPDDRRWFARVPQLVGRCKAGFPGVSWGGVGVRGVGRVCPRALRLGLGA